MALLLVVESPMLTLAGQAAVSALMCEKIGWMGQVSQENWLSPPNNNGKKSNASLGFGLCVC